MLAYLCPAALFAVRALTTVLADSLSTALLASRALTTVRTSAAHLAVRAVLHPVLARPTVYRAKLPLRALLGRLVSPILVSIGTVDIRNWNPHAWPPHRRHPSLAPREVREDELFKRVLESSDRSESFRGRE